MAIDFDLFLEWAQNHFGETNLKVRNTAHGVEICTQSIWSEEEIGKTDRRYKLWMSPHGGKKNVEEGVYRCWLTDHTGTLVELVSNLSGIAYEDAEEQIAGTPTIRNLERKVHEFFGHKEEIIKMTVVEPEISTEMELPDFSFLIDGMSSSNHWRVAARQYLRGRKIPTEGLYVCTNGDYKNRIIVPYYDKDGKLIWYNARTMSKSDKILSYMKPPEGDQDEVLFMTSWPRPGSKIYIMEGEFDAKAIEQTKFIACACGGKYLSEPQMNLLRGYQIVLAFDADTAGLEATMNVGKSLLENGFSNLRYVRPPKHYKDWNKLLIERNVEVLTSYIDRFEKPFTSTTLTSLISNQV